MNYVHPSATPLSITSKTISYSYQITHAEWKTLFLITEINHDSLWRMRTQIPMHQKEYSTKQYWLKKSQPRSRRDSEIWRHSSSFVIWPIFIFLISFVWNHSFCLFIYLPIVLRVYCLSVCLCVVFIPLILETSMSSHKMSNFAFIKTCHWL